MTTTKDLGVANLVEPWKGESNSIPVWEFFESVNAAAEMRRLNSKEKVRLPRIKLTGAARLFYSSQPQLRAEDISYDEFRTAFVNRFQDMHTDHYQYARVQNASQEKNESSEVFLDRLRKLYQQTDRSSAYPVEQAVIQQADRRLLAAFINGLLGIAGKQVKMQMPRNIDKALNMAIIATNAEKDEKPLFNREHWGPNVRVFTVGGSRGNVPGHNYNRYEGPREKSRISNRGAWSQPKAGPIRYSGRVDGSYSYGIDSRTPGRSQGQGQTKGGGAESGPRNDDERYAPGPRGIQCYRCGQLGHIRSNCQRARQKFKRDREDEIDPAIQPEMKPTAMSCTALLAVKGLVTEPVLNIRNRGRGVYIHGGHWRHGNIDSARNK